VHFNRGSNYLPSQLFLVQSSFGLHFFSVLSVSPW